MIVTTIQTRILGFMNKFDYTYAVARRVSGGRYITIATLPKGEPPSGILEMLDYYQRQEELKEYKLEIIKVRRKI